MEGIEKIMCFDKQPSDNFSNSLAAASLMNNGYEGMPFMRWLSDTIGKNIKIDWTKYA